MAKTLRGKLNRDVRLIGGKESDGGRLYLRGETVTVDKESEHLLAARRGKKSKKARPTRADAEDKQATPDATKG